MTDKNEKLILAIPRGNLFGEEGTAFFNGFCSEALGGFLFGNAGEKLWNSGIDKCFKKRGPLETDPTQKQIIPYIICYNRDIRAFVFYRRSVASGENRLHDKLSMGFGGHIDIEDASVNFSDTIMKAALREMHEELGLRVYSTDLRLLGFLNDETDAVGSVHFGIVFVADISKMPSTRLRDTLGEEVNDPAWVSVNALMEPQFYSQCEKWTQMTIPALQCMRGDYQL